MSANPLVCAILLTRDRPEMAARAVRCFERQTYKRKYLSVLDTGKTAIKDFLDRNAVALGTPAYTHLNLTDLDRMFDNPRDGSRSIGSLRNEIIAMGTGDIIVHLDDDDYSHPNRIAEQVALLQRGDYDAVGYNQMLFWDNAPVDSKSSDVWPENLRKLNSGGQAYLYTHPHADYCIGTSLCYWRRTWEAQPFPDLPIPGNPQSASEDSVWQSGLRCKAVSSIPFVATPGCGEEERAMMATLNHQFEPRMLATIHGRNHCQANYEIGLRAGDVFRRAPDWDESSRRILEAA